MPCYHPIRLRKDTPEAVTVPCGRCIGCRLERSRQWAVRIMHEAKNYERNSFVTLTYDDKNIDRSSNPDGTLVKSDLQRFWKRLRKQYGTIRYFACGEYGGITNRPHYHACIFGHNFENERQLYSTTGGNNLYRSRNLDNCWGNGAVTIGDLTFESAQYCAKYIIGKKLGDESKIYREKNIVPEYATMSLKPGIGLSHVKNYISDIYPHDAITMTHTAKKCKPPRYYDNYLKKTNPYQHEQVKTNRAESRLKAKPGESYTKRLAVKERVALARLKKREGPASP